MGGVYNLDLQTTFAGAPVYRRGTSWSLTWSLYKRSNGKWYLDFNELDDTWAGTVNYALDATDLPFAARFNRGGMKWLEAPMRASPPLDARRTTASRTAYGRLPLLVVLNCSRTTSPVHICRDPTCA